MLVVILNRIFQICEHFSIRSRISRFCLRRLKLYILFFSHVGNAGIIFSFYIELIVLKKISQKFVTLRKKVKLILHKMISQLQILNKKSSCGLELIKSNRKN